MAWLIGIDEAGYGPNLGPLVMTAAPIAIPDDQMPVDLWQRLHKAVRRHTDDDDGRLLVADSKQVYSPARGLAPLEKSVLAALHTSFYWRHGLALALNLKSLLGLLCPVDLLDGQQTDLHAESWYHGNTTLPLAADGSVLTAATESLREACADCGVFIGVCRSVVVCAPRFNDLTDSCDSKAAALAYGLTLLLRESMANAHGDDAIDFLIDKHGGRNQYGAMLTQALAAGFVWGREEGAGRSYYEVEGLDRPVRITVQPRADLEHFSVALASMVSKYVREALMAEFNAFWQGHVAELEPTAGYPGDSSRFFEQIRPAMQTLGLCERQVWRRR